MSRWKTCCRGSASPNAAVLSASQSCSRWDTRICDPEYLQRGRTNNAPALPGDLDDAPPAPPASAKAPAGLQDPRQIDLAGHLGELARVEIGRQPLPGLPA